MQEHEPDPMTSTHRDYLSAPIVPGVGIAGIRLGDTRADVIARLGEPASHCSGKRAHEQLEMLEWSGVFVGLERNRVWTVSADPGYLGCTPAGAYVGMPWHELILVAPKIRFHENAYTWYEPDVPTLDYEIHRPWRENPRGGWIEEWHDVTMPNEAVLDSMSVYAPDDSPLTPEDNAPSQ